MANYTATTVTNWFHLEHDDADLPQLRELTGLLSCEDTVHISDSADALGRPIYSFCAYDAITNPYEEEFEDGIPDGLDVDDADGEVDILGAIAELLAEGDALIVYEVGDERLRYVFAGASILAKKDGKVASRFMNFQTRIEAAAQDLLGNHDWAAAF